MRVAILVFALIAAPALAFGAAAPRPGLIDSRIQTIQYDPDQVVAIWGVLGYQLMLEFAPDERIENVSIGDSLGWQVTPNRKANLLFLKPIDRSAATNMTVVTNQRRYAFDLRIAGKTSRTPTPYVVRFIYPQVAMALAEPPEPETPPEMVNRAYAVSGAPENTPALIFDDGRMTYFEWPSQSAVPAIFAVGPDGAESLVNYGVRGRYVVVEQLSPRFALRNGKQVATVINNGYARNAR